MRIRCYRVEEARRRAPPKLSSQRPGHRKVPGLLVFQPERRAAPTLQRHASSWPARAVIVPHGATAPAAAVFINNLPRGVAGHWTGASSPHDADSGPRPGVRSISGVSSPHRQGSAAWTVWRDVQERGPLLCSDVGGTMRLAHCSSRERTTEMDQPSPGDGTGIRVRLRSGILGVRLSPGAPTFTGCSVNQVDGLPWKQEAAGSNPATQTNRFFLRV